MHQRLFYPHIRPFIDSTLPEISGGALPPGQPAAFRLGPVDAPMLFSGDSSFQVEVPEGATRVTFTLESIDPDVNADLYVRYGEDNAIQNGNVVSDYSSEGSTGNEQIVVTRQSDPPLRAGTYFVSLMLRTTGAVAEVTVTAEFDAPPIQTTIGRSDLLLPPSCRGSELANHDHLYQLLLAGGDLPNRFPFRSRNSADGLVCGTGNG